MAHIQQSLKVHMLIAMQNDLEAGVAFYQKLGFHLNFHIKDNWAEFNIHGIKLGLAKTTYEIPEHRTGFIFETENMQKLAQELQEQGLVFYKEPMQAPHGIIASIKDPSNNIIDLYEPTPEHVKDIVKEAMSK